MRCAPCRAMPAARAHSSLTIIQQASGTPRPRWQHQRCNKKNILLYAIFMIMLCAIEREREDVCDGARSEWYVFCSIHIARFTCVCVAQNHRYVIFNICMCVLLRATCSRKQNTIARRIVSSFLYFYFICMYYIFFFSLNA